LASSLPAGFGAHLRRRAAGTLPGRLHGLAGRELDLEPGFVAALIGPKLLEQGAYICRSCLRSCFQVPRTRFTAQTQSAEGVVLAEELAHFNALRGDQRPPAMGMVPVPTKMARDPNHART
jgi:hypothetical protein